MVHLMVNRKQRKMKGTKDWVILCKGMHPSDPLPLTIPRKDKHFQNFPKTLPLAGDQLFIP